MLAESLNEIVAKLKKNYCYRADYETDRYIQISYDSTKTTFEVKMEDVDIYDKPVASYEYFDEQTFLNYLLKHQESIGKWRIQYFFEN